MTALRQALADYLRVRRALGAKLDRAEKLLAQFLSYLEEHNAEVVTVEHAVAWATLPGGAGWWHALRLTAVRRFTVYLRNLDERTQIPPAGLLAHGRHRATPYLYSTGEIDALVAAARRLPTPVAAATYPAMISLLAVTGMRFGEAIALDVTDFDDHTDTVIVRAGKFGKSRLLPVHPTTADALRQYLAQRQNLLRANKLANRGVLFISAVGTRLDHSRAQKNWRTIRDMAPVGAAVGQLPAPHPRSSPQFRRRNTAGLVPPRRRRARPTAHAVDLPGPRRPHQHLLVPVGRAGTA